MGRRSTAAAQPPPPACHRRRWVGRAGAAVVAAGSLLAASVVAAGPASADSAAPTTVIVTASSAQAAAALSAANLGTGITALPLVNGVRVQLPQSSLAAVESVPGVTVTPDSIITVQSTTGTGRPGAAVFPQSTGATNLEAAGDNGSGVNVAVLDTGIDNLPDFSGRLVGGVDLTGEGNPFQDDYGHGTFVAGLIAGDGTSSGGTYTGEAPGAGLVSVKVAGASGQTDLATVIQGIAWTVANRSALNIRVLNMSLGEVPTTSTFLNPLDTAVESAWQAGIVVTVAAGNAGPFNGTIMAPGDDPLVITVGALDDNGTATTADDTMTDFSSVGPTSPDGWFKPDLVASGRSVVSLRAPGSTVDTQYPSARVGDGNFVGSGTSFSAAVTSGGVALVLADNPSLTPNQVKARLLAYADPGPVGNPFVDGHGALDAYKAATGAPVNLAQSTTQRRLSYFAPGPTVPLLRSWLVSTWDPALWTGTAWNGTAWNGTAWNGTAWNGTAWNGTAWNGTAWNGTAWNGTWWGS